MVMVINKHVVAVAGIATPGLHFGERGEVLDEAERPADLRHGGH